MKLSFARCGLFVALLLVVLAAVAGSASADPALPSSDPFYAWSGALNNVAPGAVLRSRTVTFSDAVTVPVTTTQVLYRTTSELGAPIADVATIIQPLIGAQAGKLISWQEAYDGLTSECDPSYAIQGGTPTESTNNAEEAAMVPLIEAGYTIVTADYEGEDNAFTAGRAEGMGTLDGIRAAERQLGWTPAATQVALLGYSGGAIASDWATELAKAYAPELDLVGTAEGGIAVDLEHNLSYVNGSQEWSGAIPASLVGLARAFNLPLNQYLNAKGMQIANAVGKTCLQSDLGSYPGLTYQSLLAPPYTNIDQIKPMLEALNSLIMGSGGVPRDPLFMGVGNHDGTGDGVMVAADDEGLAHTYCSEKVPVQFQTYSDADHITAAGEFLPQAVAFVTERLTGASFSDGCSSVGTGNSLAPLAYAPLRAAAPSGPYVMTARPGSVHRGRFVRISFRLTRGGAGVTGVMVKFDGYQLPTRRGGLVRFLVRLRGRSAVARARVGRRVVASARVRVVR